MSDAAFVPITNDKRALALCFPALKASIRAASVAEEPPTNVLSALALKLLDVLPGASSARQLLPLFADVLQDNPRSPLFPQSELSSCQASRVEG